MWPNYRLFLEQVQQGLIDLDEAADALEAQAKEIAEYKALCDQMGAAMTEARQNLWSLTDAAITYRMDTALTAWRAMK